MPNITTNRAITYTNWTPISPITIVYSTMFSFLVTVEVNVPTAVSTQIVKVA